MSGPPGIECRVRRRMPDGVDARMARLAGEQWGVLSLAELRACGLSSDAIALRARNGRLHPVHRQVYAVGHANLPLEGRFLAAVKACGPHALLSHFSAAALWGFVTWDDRYPEVTVPGPGTRVHAGLRVHRSSSLAAADVARHDGIPLTSPVRTLLDLAAVLGERPLRRATRQAQALHRVNVRQLVQALHRYGPRRGARKLARIVATGPAPTRSELEDAVLDVILRGGLAHPKVNAPLVLAGRRVVPDFRWPQQRLVIEADGAAWHDNQLAREDDAERQAILEAHGNRVLRVTWDQAVERPGQTLARIRAAGAPSAASGGPADISAPGGRAVPSPSVESIGISPTESTSSQGRRGRTDAERQGRRQAARPTLSPAVISTNQFKNGNHIEVDGTVFKVLEFQHVKPGKGGAFVRTKLKRASDGNVIDKTFRAGEKFRAVRTEARKMTFLYADGSDAHFMDAESYEQMAVPESAVADALRWTKPNDPVDVLFIDGQPSDLQLPASVVLEVSQTEPGLRGDTASGGGTKPATLETGATVQVPLFVDIGDKVKVDTRSGEYMSRA